MNGKRSKGALLTTVSAVVLLAVASGCGTVHHTLVLEKDYQPKADAKVEVGKVSNETGKTYDFAIEDRFKESLVDALRKEELLRTDPLKPGLMTNCRIIGYEKGDAFKRWLMPGWGSTVLTVQCDLLDSGSKVGALEAERTVDAGGGYTVGAWEKVFKQVALDVVLLIEEKIEGQQAAAPPK